MSASTQYEEIVLEFQEWLKSKGSEDRKAIEKEKDEVKQVMKDLAKLDKNSHEFTETVLYRLVRNKKSEFTERDSVFGSFGRFPNIKAFLKSYDYSDKELNKIANMIYDLAYKFQNQPEKLKNCIQEFISNKHYARRLQCSAISPILFCINDSYPIINTKIENTYNKFSEELGWGDKITTQLVEYSPSIKKCKKMIDHLNMEIKDFTTFNLFCVWYDNCVDDVTEDEDESDDEDYASIKSNVEDVDYKELLSSIDLDNLKQLEHHTLPNPDRIKIKELLQNCEKGRWQLPNFQRYFDWKKTDIRDLLESIFRDFYIGSLLLWKIDKPSFGIMPIFGVNAVDKDVRTDMIILDGQQRITALYYSIKGIKKSIKKNSKPAYFYINFKHFLQGEDRCIEILDYELSGDEQIKEIFFPFYKLENYDKWIRDFEEMAETNGEYKKIREVSRIIENKLKHFIDGFEIPYVYLPHTMELDQVIDIFERLNTRGKSLSVFDILNATLSKHDIKLRRLWDKTSKKYTKLKEYNSSDKIPIYILQSIALSYDEQHRCDKSDLLKIYSNVFEPEERNFEEIWDEMSCWCNHAIKRLENRRDGYGVMNEKSLPYLPLIPIIASLCKVIKNQKNVKECYSKLDMWYWSSVFHGTYAGAVNTQIITDYKEILLWFNDDKKVIKTVEKFRQELDINTFNIKEVKSNSAAGKGILSLIVCEGAYDFATNQSVDNADKNDKHHIFPKRSSFREHIHIGSILNFTWLSKETNTKIGSKNPSKYIKEFINETYGGEEEFKNVLNKHFINEKCYNHMLNDNFDSFIKEREKILLEEISKRVKPSTKKSFSNETSVNISESFQN